MAQVNITHFSDISAEDRAQFSRAVRATVAKVVHGLEESEIEQNSLTVMTIPIDTDASTSGADSELHVFVSGNDWPKSETGEQMSATEAKAHFDALAIRIYDAVRVQSNREIYVWITPFAASGWAEAH